MILSARKSADRIRLTALPKPILHPRQKKDRAEARSVFPLENPAPSGLLPQPEKLLVYAEDVGVGADDDGAGHIQIWPADIRRALQREAAQPVQNDIGFGGTGDENGIRRGRRRAGLHANGTLRRDPGAASVNAQFEEHIEEAADAEAARVGSEGVFAERLSGRAFAQHERAELAVAR